MNYHILFTLSAATLFALSSPATAMEKPMASEAADSEDASKTQLSPNENKDLVREWFRLYEVKKIDEHNAMIHPDARVVYPEMQYTNPDNSMGMEGLKKTLELDENAFVDLHMRIDKIWAVDNTVFVEGFFIGSKLSGVLNEMARGSNSKVSYLHRIEIQDRQIILVHSYYDTALFYQVQLGLEGPTMEEPIAPWMKALGAESAARKASK